MGKYNFRETAGGMIFLRLWIGWRHCLEHNVRT